MQCHSERSSDSSTSYDQARSRYAVPTPRLFSHEDKVSMAQEAPQTDLRTATRQRQPTLISCGVRLVAMPHSNPPTWQLFGAHCDLSSIIRATQHSIDDLLYDVQDHISSERYGRIKAETNPWDRTALYFKLLDDVASLEWTQATRDWFERSPDLHGKLSKIVRSLALRLTEC